MHLENATQPTMYFIGVTTGSSSIMKVFPEWAKALGLENTVIKGIDIAIHEKAEVYREVVSFIKNDPLSLGALITTHKIDLYDAAKDLFDYLDPYALQFGELSSISKKDGKLCGHAKDPITCGMAMEEFVTENYWKDHPDAGVFIMGAGGSAISMCSYYMRNAGKGNDPKKIVIANRSKPRLDEIERICKGMNPHNIPVEYYLTPEPGQNDAVLAKMGKGSLVINATGLGKDRPGSPLTDAAVFPEDALVWELNYRGERLFMHQAETWTEKRNVKVIDGWMYFIFGWTQVIAEVFHTEILGERLKAMDQIAAVFNNRLPAAKKEGGFNVSDKALDFLRGFTVDFDLQTGLSKKVETGKRYLSQMKGMFADDAAYEAELKKDDVMVYEFHGMPVPEHPGDLAFGCSILNPGKVGDEYYFTKGHFHTILDTGEVYYCLKGHGYMLLENPEGDWSAQELKAGTAVYVPKRYAHRSINVSEDEQLVTFFVFRADAGHDYGTIETKGYRKLLVERDGVPTIIDNPKWR